MQIAEEEVDSKAWSFLQNTPSFSQGFSGVKEGVYEQG